MTDISKGIRIYFNKDYPYGYTITNSRREAYDLCKVLTEQTHKSWSIVSGENHWKTDKPAYYKIWTDEPNKTTP